ncbi:MAG: DUF2163 domain-containing protein [Paracoccaceae bacterium]
MTAEALYAHLETGCTTVCHLWHVIRQDGKEMGFTDHDRDIVVDGVTFRADTGLTAQALQQTTGFSVDNTEALGALSSLSISDVDIAAGRFDKAAVTAWMVNWQDLSQRVCLFRGNFGEIMHSDGMFRVELRGLTDGLNQPQGRTFHRSCGAILGDKRCKVDFANPANFHEENVSLLTRDEVVLANANAFAPQWFVHGSIEVRTGAARGLRAVVKADVLVDGVRKLSFWEGLAIAVSPGDIIRVTAGCDRMAQTCRSKFDNLLNFRGFPHIPGDDWVTSYPVSNTQNTGESQYRGA